MRLSEIPTPALVLDRGRLRKNLARMAQRAKAGGVELRPHLKTAKSEKIARLATEGFSGGITVSTLAEAAYFIERGFVDLTYAVCMVPDKLPSVRALVESRDGVTVNLLVDSVAGARGLAAASAGHTVVHPVFIEVDSGEHRTGLHPEAPALLAVAEVLRQAPMLNLVGVLTHGGHAYACRTVDDIKEVAEQERTSVVTAAARLRTAGHACPVVSAGSTPTMVHAPSFEGLTEIRPGVYMFFDLDQYGLGCCDVHDIALSVLSSVLSRRLDYRRLIIDAGGLAMSKDHSAQANVSDAGYGWVVDITGQHRLGDLRVTTLNQEHGYVQGDTVATLGGQMKVGDRVRVLPNHACMTAAAHAEYVVVDGDDEVVDRWDRVGGWYLHP